MIIWLKIQTLIKQVELRLSLLLEKRITEAYSTKLFSFDIKLLNFYLLSLELLGDLFKYLIILFKDPGDSFNLFFKQKELRSCPFSYHNFKQTRAKLRMFSVSGATAMVVVGVMTSLITNFLFGGKLPGQAETFGWEQTSWNRASTTAVANHNSDQTTWNYFYSKDASVSTSSGVRLTTASGGWYQTSDTDFNANITTAGVYVNSGSIKLLKPEGATCGVDGDCNSGWCQNTICGAEWISGPCAGIQVRNRDLTAQKQWKTTDTSCGATECQTGLDTGLPANMVLKFSNAINFSEYPARDACKSLGGRLPTKTELVCMYNNKASYRDNFQPSPYVPANDSSPTSIGLVAFSNGFQGSGPKTNNYYVRCVK